MRRSSKRIRYASIFLHGRLVSTNEVKEKRIIREMAGLELLIQKGIMVDAAFNRLKELADKLK